jgi:ubiquinone/menaquinone biosynthesis C-methylase UbiE
MKKLRSYLGRVKTIIFRRFISNWRSSDGGNHEVLFWANWISQQKITQNPDFLFRINPKRPLQNELTTLMPWQVVSPEILDVGCGPLSTVGICFSNGHVRLTGADPLADDYKNILEEEGIKTNCELIKCAGEELSKRFGKNKFDLVCAFNSLDHAVSPIKTFDEMLSVCKINGYVYLWHAENEGLEERYSGMHQWNFQQKKNRPLVNDGRNLCELIQDLTKVEIIKLQKEKKEKTFLKWIFKKVR